MVAVLDDSGICRCGWLECVYRFGDWVLMGKISPIKPPRTNDPKEVERFYRALAERAEIITSDGSPAASIVPRWIGDECFDVTNNEWYRSTGLTSSDWKKVT